jgi:hypothetical protein
VRRQPARPRCGVSAAGLSPPFGGATNQGARAGSRKATANVAKHDVQFAYACPVFDDPAHVDFDVSRVRDQEAVCGRVYEAWRRAPDYLGAAHQQH